MEAPQKDGEQFEALPSEIDPEQDVHRNRFSKRKIIAGVLAGLSLTTVIQNVDEVNRWRHILDDGSLMPSVAGCEGYEPTDTEVAGTVYTASLKEIETAMKDTKSAAHSIKPEGFNLLKSFEQVKEFYKYPQTSFVSEQSGINFNFYSDQSVASWRLDEEAFDDAFHFALQDSTRYSNREVSYLMSCLKERVIVDQEFSGAEYNVYIPSKNACLANGRIVYPPARYAANICQQSGGTPPIIQAEFLLWKPISERIMILTSGGRSLDQQQYMTNILVHESIHAYLTLTDTPLRLDPDEQWVKLQANQLGDAKSGLRPFLSFD